MWSKIKEHLDTFDYFRDSEQAVSFLSDLLRRALDIYEQGGVLPDEDLARCTAAAVRAAERDEPITPLLHAWEAGCSAAVASCWLTARQGEQSELVAVTQWASSLGKRITADLSLAHLHARQRTGLDDSRRILAELLLDGSATQEVAAAAQHTLMGRYLVVVGTIAGEAEPSAATVARGTVALATDDAGLCCRVGTRLCVLSVDRGGAGAGAGVGGAGPAEAAAGVVELLRQAGVGFGSPVGAVVAPRAKLSAAVQHASRVESLARAAKLDADAVESHQVINELAIARDSEYRKNLISLISPIQEAPELINTLRILYLMDLDRTRTARRLNVARRTLTYRLERIEQITGFNPVHTRGILTFVLALAAQDLEPYCPLPVSVPGA